MILPGNFYLIFKKPFQSLASVFLILNIFIFIYSELFFDSWPSPSLVEQFKDKDFSNTIIQMYIQTLDPVEINERSSHHLLEPTLTEALRDQRFFKKIKSFPFAGNQIQIDKVKSHLLHFQNDYYLSSQYNLGLGPIQTSPWAWVTYQFTHASLFHLIGNGLILFLLISCLESTVSYFWIVSVYLLGGFGGGALYLLNEMTGSMAVVGASSSIFSLMGFLILVKKNEIIPWSYILGPWKGGYGIIYLPVFFVFPLFLMTELISFLWNNQEAMSSVAVSAHIGGLFTGMFLALVYLTDLYFKSKIKSKKVTEPHYQQA
jgi:membrane associated rhomboid family serine protease